MFYDHLVKYYPEHILDNQTCENVLRFICLKFVDEDGMVWEKICSGVLRFKTE